MGVDEQVQKRKDVAEKFGISEEKAQTILDRQAEVRAQAQEIGPETDVGEQIPDIGDILESPEFKEAQTEAREAITPTEPTAKIIQRQEN
jgi:hypothetical protein